MQGFLLTPGTSKAIQRQLGHIPSHCHTGPHTHPAPWKNPISVPTLGSKSLHKSSTPNTILFGLVNPCLKQLLIR